MKVEIRPIQKEKWHGKKGTEDFTQTKVIEALVDVETHRLATGLTEEETIEYGKKLNVDLNPTIPVDGKPHPFYGKPIGWLKLENRTIIFETDNPLDFVKVKLAKESKFVANSMKDYLEGRYPFATHVIHDEEMETTIKASKIQKKNAAIKISLSLSLEEKASLVAILRNKIVNDRSQDFVDVIIDEIIETNPDEFIRFAKMDRDEVFTRAIVLEAIYKNILTKEGSSIYYMDSVLGTDYEAAVEYFMNPQNQKQKIAILEKVERKEIYKKAPRKKEDTTE